MGRGGGRGGGRVDQPVGEAGAHCGTREERGEGGDQQVRELAEGAGRPGVDLEVPREGVGGLVVVEVGKSVRLEGQGG